MQTEYLRKRLASASGSIKAQLVLKNARVVNVFTDETELCDVAVSEGIIVGLGSYDGECEIDIGGRYVCPGLIDGHIHMESSMVCPAEFEKAVLPHGTTAVITDPHEIANVAGTAGIDFMLEATKNLDLSVYFMLPSCVPDAALDESGAEIDAKQLAPYYTSPRVLGLAEMMNFHGTVDGDETVLRKLCQCTENGRIIDGHAPFLSGKKLCAYICAGVRSDHECSHIDEAMEKLRRGQYIMIRQGTAAKNLDALLPLFKQPYCQRCMLVTDDKHPGDLIHGGHIDYIIRRAVSLGASPFAAIKMGTLVPAEYFGLKNCGAVAPGYIADMIVVSDLESFQVDMVFKNGRLVAENGKMLETGRPFEVSEKYERVFNSFCTEEIRPEELIIDETGEWQRVIQLTPNELLTEERIVPLRRQPGTAEGVDVENDIVKLAIFERHRHTGHRGIGFLGGYGLKCGAVASSIAHDSHNLVIAGTNDRDMALAGNTVIKNRGGLAFVVDGELVGELPLPVAGLMSLGSVYEVDAQLQRLKNELEQRGIDRSIDAFMTLAFVSLPVIPKLRLSTHGVVDADKQQIVPAIF